MNFLYQTFRDHLSQNQRAAVLLAGTCQGNDPQLPPCPLFHGSLAPMLFSDIDHDYYVNFQSLLLNSHNITWAKTIYFPKNLATCREVCDTLSKTRYSSRSIKSVRVHYNSLSVSVPFIKRHCQAVKELLEIHDRVDMKSEHLALLAELSFIIKTLDLSFCNQIKDFSPLFATTTASSVLQHLNVEGCYKIVTDGALLHFSKLKNLQSLDVRWCSRITDVGLRNLSSSASTQLLPRLERLELTGCDEITSEGCKYLSQLTSLRILVLDKCCSLDGESLLHLSELPTLERLSVSECREIGDEGLSHFAKNLLSVSLQELVLSGCDQITDMGVLHLSSSESHLSASLRHLDLRGCQSLTGACLPYFSKMSTSLKNIDLRFIKAILTEDLEKLQKDLPDAEILF